MRGDARPQIIPALKSAIKGVRRTIFPPQTFGPLSRGRYLKENAKTDYIRKVFNICTEQARSRNWNELGLEMKDKVLRFEVLAEDEWEAKLNQVLTV